MSQDDTSHGTSIEELNKSIDGTLKEWREEREKMREGERQERREEREHEIRLAEIKNQQGRVYGHGCRCCERDPYIDNTLQKLREEIERDIMRLEGSICNLQIKEENEIR